MVLKQRKIKSKPSFDLAPYVVIEVVGHQIKARQGHKEITRDAQTGKSWNSMCHKTMITYERRHTEQQQHQEKDWFDTHQEDGYVETPTTGLCSSRTATHYTNRCSPHGKTWSIRGCSRPEINQRKFQPMEQVVTLRGHKTQLQDTRTTLSPLSAQGQWKTSVTFKTILN